MEISVTTTGLRRTILHFEHFPEAARTRLRAALENIEARLEAAIRAAEPARTGRLRGETGGRVYESGTRIAAVVGVRTPGGTGAGTQEAAKAAALEYGAHRKAPVRAHEMTLAHFWSRGVKPRKVHVKRHNRTADIKAVAYLRGPFEALRAEALAEMQAALADAEAEA